MLSRKLYIKRLGRVVSALGERNLSVLPWRLALCMHVWPLHSTLLLDILLYSLNLVIACVHDQGSWMYTHERKRERPRMLEEFLGQPFDEYYNIRSMRSSELGIQLLLAAALGLPILVLLGYVGLRQFRLFLFFINELSAPRTGLPSFLRPCKLLRAYKS